MNITPDGYRYLAMGRGERAPMPFHMRPLAPFLARNYAWRWFAIQVGSALVGAILLGVYLHQHDLDGWAIAAGIAIACLLGGVGRTVRVFPIIVDPLGQALALGAAVSWLAGYWWLAIALAVLAGATKETAALWAAVFAWTPVLLIGLVPVALILLRRPGDDLEPYRNHRGPMRWPFADPFWRDATVALLPWGPCLAALVAPTPQLAVAAVLAYGQLVVVESLGWTFSVPVDCARVYEWAYPVALVGALAVIPAPWLAVAVAVALFNPWGRGPDLANQRVRQPDEANTVTMRRQPGRVAIGYCTRGVMEAEFADSVHRVYVDDRAHYDQLTPYPLVITGGCRLHILRDNLVRLFLDTDAEWLVCIDDDMAFADDAVRALVMSADPVERPIVGALCFGSGRSGGKMFPTIFRWNDNGFTSVNDYPHNAMVECDATGWAFICVHRSVLETMRDAYTEAGDDLQPWFPDGQVGDYLIEGDLAFCLRARNLGYRVFVNTAVHTRHKKPTFLDEQFYDLVSSIESSHA